MAMLLRIIAGIAGIYLILLVLVYLIQDSFIYHPDTKASSPEKAGLEGFSEIKIKASDHILTSWWHPPADETKPVILHLHGNGGALAGRASIYAELATSGAGVLAVGYPGYGGNAGEPHEYSFYQVTSLNYKWLGEQGYRPAQIVIAGQSMGTGPATWLAQRTRVAGLILEAPYTSLADMAARQMPIFPSRLLVKDKYDNLSRIAEIDMPLAWIHGEDDTLIPVEMGQQLFDAAKAPKCAFRIEDAGHNDLWQKGAREIVTEQASAMVGEGECEGAG